MIFAETTSPGFHCRHITIQNKKILQEKYRGVTLESDLTWHEHVDNMKTKINQRLGVLRRIKDTHH